MAAGQSYQLETKLRRLEQSTKTRFGGTTDSELSELEDVVALTAARVQSAESEVGRHADELSSDWFSRKSEHPTVKIREGSLDVWMCEGLKLTSCLGIVPANSPGRWL